MMSSEGLHDLAANGTPAEKAAAARAMIKQIYEDKVATVNGRDYKFLTMVHRDRRAVFAFMTSVGPAMQRNDMSFLDGDAFAPIERIISDHITFNAMQLSKLPKHWEDEGGYPEDYIPLLTSALQVISYPFVRAAPTS